MDYNAIAAYGTWAAIVGAAVILYFQNRAAKKLTCLQLFLQLADRYDSEEMNLRRARLARALLANRETLKIDDTILVFFENVALMIRRGLLDSDLTWNTFGIDVCTYWYALEHYVKHMRAVFNDPTFYNEFEWLNQYMRARSERIAPDSRVGIERAAVDQFLEMETLRSLEPAAKGSETQQTIPVRKRKFSTK